MSFAGLAWTGITLPANIGTYVNLEVSPSEALAVSQTNSAYLRSTDGKNWTVCTTPLSGTNWGPLFWTGTSWLMARNNNSSTNAIARSTDGTDGSWVTHNSSTSSSGFRQFIKNTSGRIYLFATGANVQYSDDDGVSWANGTSLGTSGMYAGDINSSNMGVTVSGVTASDGKKTTDGFGTVAGLTSTYTSQALVHDSTNGRFVSISSSSGHCQYVADGGSSYSAGADLPVTSFLVLNRGFHFNANDGTIYGAYWLDSAAGGTFYSTNGGTSWSADTALGASTGGRWSFRTFGNVQIAIESGTIGAWRQGPSSYSITSAGGAVAGGANTIKLGQKVISSGGAVAGGSSTLVLGIKVISSGGAVAGGIATQYGTFAGTNTYSITSSGGAVAGGSSTIKLGLKVLSTGGAIAGGSSTISVAYAPGLSEYVYTETVVDSTGAPITGGASKTSIFLKNINTGYIMDWSDVTMKASGWGSITDLLSEAIYPAGEYGYNVPLSGLANGRYCATLKYTPTTPTSSDPIQTFQAEFYMNGGYVVDQYMSGKLDSAVSTRATPADIPTAVQNATELLAEAALTPMPSNVKKMNDAIVKGTGQPGNLWRGA